MNIETKYVLGRTRASGATKEPEANSLLLPQGGKRAGDEGAHCSLVSLDLCGLINRCSLLSLLLMLLLSAGCKTGNVNPWAARPNTGYVDLYCPDDTDASWEVKQIQPQSGKTKTLFSDMRPVKRIPLRLALPPGRQRLQVTFLNRAVLTPALVDVAVIDQVITPVRVTLRQTGNVITEKEELTFRTTVRGYGQAPEREDIPAGVYRITAICESPFAYQPKEAFAYSK